MSQDPLFAPVVPDGAQPPYVLASRALAQAITTGTLPAGTRLPSERYLCEQLAISRVTLRRALQGLAGQGLLESDPRRGWRVRAGDFAYSADNLAGFTAFNRAAGRAITARVLSAATRPPEPGDAEQLRLSYGANVFELRRLRFLDAAVLCIARDLVPLDLAPDIAEVDFATASMFAVLTRSGQRPETADFTAHAALATQEESTLLELPAVAAVFHAERVSFTANGTPCVISREVYRADRYQFRVTLS